MVDLTRAGRRLRDHPVAEPVPVALEARARRIRRHRRLGVLIPVMAAIVGAGVAVVATSGSAPTVVMGTGPSGLHGRPPATAVPVPVRDGEQVTLSQVGDIAFVGRDRAYGVVSGSDGTFVAVTSDGGRSWRVAGSRLFASATPADATRIGIGPSGELYAYDPSGSTVVVSTDGARTWTRHVFRGSVVDVTTGGATLFALVRNLRLGSPIAPATLVYAATGADGHWQARVLLPAQFLSYQLLVAPTASRVYALAPGEHNTNAGLYGGLARSTDGGMHWSAVEQPCSEDAAPRFGQDVEFGAANAKQLWMVCSQDNGDGRNLTQVARSDDGGSHWTIVAGSTGVSVRPQVFPPASGIPDVAVPDTAVFGREDAWIIVSSPAGVLRTTDGGVRWMPAGPGSVERDEPVAVYDADGTIEVRTATALLPLTG